MVVDADSLFTSRLDQEFINDIRQKRSFGLRHTFFVLTTDRGLSEEEKQEKVEQAKNHLKEDLGDGFQDRVFIVNAADALEHRAAETTNMSVLEATKLPDFERSVVRFLKGADFTAALLEAAAQDVLKPIMSKVSGKIKYREKTIQSIKARIRHSYWQV